jgi:hypothetical protein
MDYYGGLRYLKLDRVEQTIDLLSDIYIDKTKLFVIALKPNLQSDNGW